MADSASKKPKCKYWDKCFRKNAEHKAHFLHPGDDDDDDKGRQSDDNDEGSKESKSKNKLVGARIDLRKKRLVFAGTFTTISRQKLIARAKMFGCVIQSSISSATDALICGDSTGKAAEDAKKRDVKVYSVEEWEGVLLQARPVRGYKASRRNKNADQCSDSEDEDYEPGARKKGMPAARRKRKSSDDLFDTKRTKT